MDLLLNLFPILTPTTTNVIYLQNKRNRIEKEYLLMKLQPFKKGPAYLYKSQVYVSSIKIHNSAYKKAK